MGRYMLISQMSVRPSVCRLVGSSQRLIWGSAGRLKLALLPLPTAHPNAIDAIVYTAFFLKIESCSFQTCFSLHTMP